MLKIQNNSFEIKYTEINIRQRMFEKQSYVTMIINTEFFPSLVGENIISGSIEIKLDLKDVKSLDDFINNYEGEIGNVVISINNNGIWEHDSKDKFKISIKKRDGKKLEFELKTDNCLLKDKGTIVSLYTTSASIEELEKNFDLKDFYNNPITREIGNKKVYKYFIKN